MASILRQIVAGPRLQHPEAGLDLCYVTDNIIATSGPSSNYPQRAYRNPLESLVSFLDNKHGENWCIYEFRAEGTGYPDEQVYGRIHHYPFPDHHPPPFALIPMIMGSMHNWLNRLEDTDQQDKSADKGKRVAVVHCKAGKGRSGTVACSYLISQEGWKIEDALQRFTERRMRVGFGPGVSIPSQLRWVRYVDRWTNQMDKKYVERPVEILEIQVWGLRDGVKVAVEGFVDEGKKIKSFHLFHRKERLVVDSGKTTPAEKDGDKINSDTDSLKEPNSAATGSSGLATPTSGIGNAITPTTSSEEALPPKKHTSSYIFRPSKPIIIPTCDVNIDFERRSKAAYTGWAMVTSIAHIWFNTYFEGGDEKDSGVFEADWEALDGIKGTTKKGVKALDRVKVVWRHPTPSQLGLQESEKEGTAPVSGHSISEPGPGETALESHPADWRGQDPEGSKDSLQDPEKSPVRAAEEKNNETKGLTSETSHPLISSITTTAASAAATATSSVQEISRELGKELGLRKQTDESKDVSLAESDDNSSVLGRRKNKTAKKQDGEEEQPPKVQSKPEDNGDFEGTRPYFGNGDSSQEKSSDEKKDDKKEDKNESTKN